MNFASPGTTAITLATVALAFAAAAFGAPPREGAPIGDWSEMKTVAPGSDVRLSLADGRKLRGRLGEAATDSIVINLANGQERVARQEIRRVQVRMQGHRGRNTLVGFGVGTLTGFAVGAVVDARSGDSFFPNAGKAVLGVLGMVVGTVTGVAMPAGGWREVYRAP